MTKLKKYATDWQGEELSIFVYMKIGTCTLCLQQKPLLVKSHIISGFLYREVLAHEDKTNKSVNTLTINSVEDKVDKLKQHTKVTDGNILCQNCDNVILSKYEDYAKGVIDKFVQEKLKPPLLTVGGNKYISIDNVDCKKLKLFVLSLLFRAHHSKSENFSEVNLNPEYLERIRLMLLSGDAGQENEFPIMLFYYYDAPENAIVQFRKVNTGSHDAYQLIAAQFGFTCVIGKDIPNMHTLDYPQNKVYLMYQKFK